MPRCYSFAWTTGRQCRVSKKTQSYCEGALWDLRDRVGTVRTQAHLSTELASCGRGSRPSWGLDTPQVEKMELSPRRRWRPLRCPEQSHWRGKRSPELFRAALVSGKPCQMPTCVESPGPAQELPERMGRDIDWCSAGPRSPELGLAHQMFWNPLPSPEFFGDNSEIGTDFPYIQHCWGSTQ